MRDFRLKERAFGLARLSPATVQCNLGRAGATQPWHGTSESFIGWDAADWEHITPLLEEGLMPTLDAFINRGVMGNLATLQSIHRAGPDERRRSALHEHVMQA